jgi:2-isopropylmalate synthase
MATGVNTTEIARTSRLVSRLTGYAVQPNKAIVGRNAFAHESGIHQDGVLKERTTYEIMDATSVGLATNSLVLGKHSGRHALRQALENLGIEVHGQALNTAFKRFKEIADRKKTVTAMDLEALVTDELREEIAGYTLESYELEAGSDREPHAAVVVRTPDGSIVRGERSGDGSVDSVFAAINAATGSDARLREFRIDAVTEGQDALGEVSVVVDSGGQTASGQGVATDIIEAAARAYLRALTTLLRRERSEVSADASALAPAS